MMCAGALGRLSPAELALHVNPGLAPTILALNKYVFVVIYLPLSSV